MSNVEVRHCGQGAAYRRYSLQVASLGEKGRLSSFSNLSVHSGYHTAWGVHASVGVTLRHSVLFKSVGSTVVLGKSSSGNWLLGNLGLLTINPGSHRDTLELEK